VQGAVLCNLLLSILAAPEKLKIPTAHIQVDDLGEHYKLPQRGLERSTAEISGGNNFKDFP